MKSLVSVLAIVMAVSVLSAEPALTLSGAKLKPGERIVAFSLHTRCVRVAGVRSLPPDWTLTISPSEDGGGSIVTGSCHHGASSLTRLEDLIAFGFAFTKECKDQEIEGDVSVTKDFEVAERRKISGEVIFGGDLQQTLPSK